MTTFYGFPRDGHPYSGDEVGRAMAGLVRRESNGVPRTGMLASGPSCTAVASSWKVQVGLFTYVHQVNGAVQFSGLSASEQVDIVPAAGDVPAGQARIDLICWDYDTPQLVVVKGTPAANPVEPPAAGLAFIQSVRVASGDGSVVQGQMTPRYSLTGLAGAIMPWLRAANAGNPADRILLKNGWTNNVNVNWDGLNTQVSVGGLLINGAVTKATPYASLEVIGTLPPSMRPLIPMLMGAAYAIPGGYVLVRKNGDIVTSQAGNGGQIAIGGFISTEA